MIRFDYLMKERKKEKKTRLSHNTSIYVVGGDIPAVVGFTVTEIEDVVPVLKTCASYWPFHDRPLVQIVPRSSPDRPQIVPDRPRSSPDRPQIVCSGRKNT